MRFFAIIFGLLLFDSIIGMQESFAPPNNLRFVDEFTNTVDTVVINQQIQITTDVGNGKPEPQPFVYIVQIKNDADKVIFLDWEIGLLLSGEENSPKVSWTPQKDEIYVATAFVWESFLIPIPLETPISSTTKVKEIQNSQ